MKSYRRTVQVIIFIAVVLLGGYAIGNTLFASDGVPRKGDKAPEFSLLGLDGKVHKLSEYRGKPVIVNFWGSFCPECVTEMPAIESQFEKWKGKVDVLGVNLSEDPITVRSFVSNFDVKFPIILDKNKATEKKYGLQAYPTTFFINEEGKIADIFVGGMKEPDVEQRIAKMLE